MKWTSASASALFAFGLIQIAVLTHLLRPSDFGLMAATISVIGFAEAFGDMGLSSAIIARQTTSRETLSSLYWTNVLAGIVVFAVIFETAPLIADFYHQPRLRTLISLAALSFLIKPFGQQFMILLQRDLIFERIAKVEIAAMVGGVGVAIATAALGAGAKALVWGFLTQAVVSTAFLVGLGVRNWRPMLRLRGEDLRGYLGFGLYQMGERSVNFLSSNIDYILIGRYLGFSALGAYAIAYQLVVKPLFQLNPILTRVAFPAFARKQDDPAALRRGYLAVVRLIAFIVLPVLGGLAVAAPALVPAVFGGRWQQSVVLIEILATLGIAKALMNPVGSLLLAKNRPDVGFKVNAAYLAVLGVALFVAVQFSIVAVAATQTVIVVAEVVFWQLFVRRMIELSFASLASMLRSPFFNAGVMVVVMLAGRLILQSKVESHLLLTIVIAAIGAATYTLLVALDDRHYVKELLGLIQSRAEATSPLNAVAGKSGSIA